MEDRCKRKIRMLELIQKNKGCRKPKLDTMLEECIEAVYPEIVIVKPQAKFYAN